jgi:hypothetical protein
VETASGDVFLLRKADLLNTTQIYFWSSVKAENICSPGDSNEEEAESQGMCGRGQDTMRSMYSEYMKNSCSTATLSTAQHS